jgi:hypothetical protein
VLPPNARGVRGYLRAIYDHLTGEATVDLSPLGATADAATANTVVGRLKAIANALATTASNFLAVRLTDGTSYLTSTAGRLHVADGGVALNVDPADRAGRLLGHVTVDAIPEVEVKNDTGSPLAVRQSGIAPPLGYAQLSISNAAGLGAPPGGAVTALVIPHGGAVRWRDDGTSPTASVGMYLAADTPLTYQGTLSALKLIAVTGTVEVNVSFYGAET